ncbi:MAG: DUF3617 family protein [Acidobacteria bacterium]|nr:MAG: DUF3617 family protein [Acidobacteriota bacterium]
MNVRFSSVALLTVALSYTALAQTQSPMRAGNWEVTTKMNMAGMDMPPAKHTQCVTQEMLKDPQSSIPKGPGGGDCKMSDYTFTSNTATYKMVCTKPQAMTMVGEMKYSGTDSYTGTMQMEMSGQKVTMSMDAKRIGDCPK